MSEQIVHFSCAILYDRCPQCHFASAAVTVDSSNMTAPSLASRSIPPSNFVNGQLGTCQCPHWCPTNWIRNTQDISSLLDGSRCVARIVLEAPRQSHAVAEDVTLAARSAEDRLQIVSADVQSPQHLDAVVYLRPSPNLGPTTRPQPVTLLLCSCLG